MTPDWTVRRDNARPSPEPCVWIVIVHLVSVLVPARSALMLELEPAGGAGLPPRCLLWVRPRRLCVYFAAAQSGPSAIILLPVRAEPMTDECFLSF